MGRVKDWGSRKDANHGLIVKIFEQLNCKVKDVSSIPGFVDLIVKRGPVLRLVEIKDPEKSPSERKLTKPEEEFWKYWGEPPVIVETADDAMRLVNEMIHGHLHIPTKWDYECATTD